MKNTERTETRKSEILNIAESLFIEKGYIHTTINDILIKSGISKGSLYYHYKSKEDILDDIIKRIGDKKIEAANHIAKTKGIDAQTKFLQAIFSLNSSDDRQAQLTTDLEKSSDGQMFIKSLADIVLRLAPILLIIVEQGISEGVFTTVYPLETVEILLCAAHALFDNGNLAWMPEEQKRRLSAFIFITERALGAQEGSLTELSQMAMPDEGE
ncbi:MAG: TetR/AcrR family transcriptional regulator [Eubacteriaceae bacterium]|nr:TetR/AcrR family transcriptional regulator [Eubacteriaceae bacterium]